MEEIEAPSPIDFKPEKNKLEFILKESFEIKSDNKIFILSISYNDNLILFEVEIKDIFPKEEYNIYLSLEQLGKINKYFLQFDSLKEVFESLKFLIQKNFLNIFEEEKNMKIKLINLVNGKEIIINIPLKQKDSKAEIDSIIPYVIKLNEKISNLEQKVKLHEDKIEILEKN